MNPDHHLCIAGGGAARMHTNDPLIKKALLKVRDLFHESVWRLTCYDFCIFTSSQMK